MTWWQIVLAWHVGRVAWWRVVMTRALAVFDFAASRMSKAQHQLARARDRLRPFDTGPDKDSQQ